MSRIIKNTLIAAAIESAYGSDANPTGSANAILVSDVSATPLDAQNIDRNLIRGTFGASEQLVGSASVKLSYSTELAGSGTAGTAPAWGKLLGAMGDFTLSAKVGERPMLKFDWTGLDGGISAASDTGTFTPWKRPVSMTKANVVDITLGATYAAGAISGGTVYPSTGLEMKAGNQVAFTPMLSSETVDITDRESTGSLELDLTAAQEVTMMAAVKANTTQSLAITIGLATGNKILFFAPAVQFINPKKSEKNGKRLIGFDTRFMPVNGNDEWRIVCL